MELEDIIHVVLRSAVLDVSTDEAGLTYPLFEVEGTVQQVMPALFEFMTLGDVDITYSVTILSVESLEEPAIEET